MKSTSPESSDLDVLCVGLACWDLVFSVDHHPGPDEKATATAVTTCGGGPAANAAVAAARLGVSVAFAGYLGDDVYGRAHRAELSSEGVGVDGVLEGRSATPVSAVLVKPDGSRTVINYRKDTPPLDPDRIDLQRLRPRVLLLDGHQPGASRVLADRARELGIATVLDAGSVHAGTLELLGRVDVLAASRRFAVDFTGCAEEERLAERLADQAPVVVVTLGAGGLVWQQGGVGGRLGAYPVAVVDSTGAGDAFHGAFAAGWAMGMEWSTLLRFAAAAGALCCTVAGARPGMPSRQMVDALMSAHGPTAIEMVVGRQ